MLGIHEVHRMHQSTTQEHGPHAIHGSPRQERIVSGHGFSECLPARKLRIGRSYGSLLALGRCHSIFLGSIHFFDPFGRPGFIN